ncbi:nucleoside 2-deoxyribosyltransferase [Mesoplasma lactucae]|uniref:Uncharacterized protein n=1 Tax=Mesoplasma lactucae ATCC 49193 TaxID=81460 RepID=A0A291ISH0_9MOLU|nr:nucleoside 2-deoxyribosyltransferase [Mesoplasma lactucae]ATG97703.1 hypothetical protein CP520_03115 [Mesoplasma lactucae ATCC 49193]ATZ19831.1 hypothetical protein MLACT_v1c00060 [Mesoplasma lactucae ATCC 49193]MCL8216694.1 hypothetical protein [Mesoplasma lactucae ATCC 49193]
MKNKIIYNAGSMFNEAQWDARKREGEELRKMFPDYTIKNPVDFDTNQGTAPTNEEIFALDYKGIKESDIVILEMDGWDSGTHMEFGLVVEMAKNDPSKLVFPIISDFRYKQGVIHGEIVGFGLNEMITGAFYDKDLNKGDVPQLTVVDSHKSAREAIKAILTGDTKNYRERFDIKDLYKQTNDVYHGFNK